MSAKLRAILVVLMAIALVAIASPGALAGPDTEGEWGDLLTWDTIGPEGHAAQAIHSILLKNGKILCVNEEGDVWLFDPANETQQPTVIDGPMIGLVYENRHPRWRFAPFQRASQSGFLI